jgi:hypothetical protein
MPTFLPSHPLALHLLTFLFFKIFVLIRVHPLPAIALAQARRAGWFPLSSFLIPISYFWLPHYVVFDDPGKPDFQRKKNDHILSGADTPSSDSPFRITFRTASTR